MSSLLPDGCSDLKDVPYVFFDAIRHALIVLSFDELPSEDRPPRRIWRDGEKLRDWFDMVNKRRDEKYGLDRSRDIEDPVENPILKDIIKE